LELSLGSTLGVAKYAIRVLGTDMLREFILGSETNLSWNSIAMAGIWSRTLITPKS
jgi:hypothetical protein